MKGKSAKTEYFFREAITIGSGGASGVRLEEAAVSREHAVIEKLGDGFRIRAIGAKDRVVIKGKRVKSAPLANSSRFQVGAAEFVFLKYGSDVTRAAVTPARAARTAVAPAPRINGLAPRRLLRDPAEASLVTVGEIAGRLDRLPREAGAGALAAEVLDAVLDITRGDRAALFLKMDGKLVEAGVRHAPGPRKADGPVINSVIGEVLRAGAAAEEAAPEAMAVPVTSRNGVRGVLYVDARPDRRGKVFGGHALPALGLIGRAVGRFIEDASQHRLGSRQLALRQSLAHLFGDSSGPGTAGRPAPREIQGVVLSASVRTLPGNARLLRHEVFMSLLDAFFRRVQAAIVRHHGVIELVDGATIKAVFRFANGKQGTAPVQAALEIHNECFGSNLRAKMIGGIEIEVRVSLEVGALTVGLVGAEPLTHLTSLGDPVYRTVKLLELAERGDILVGPTALERWEADVVQARIIPLADALPGTRGAMPGRAILGFSHHTKLPLADLPVEALERLPVQVRRAVDGGAPLDGVLLADPDEPTHLSLHLTWKQKSAPLAGAPIVYLDLDLYPHDGLTTIVGRVDSVEKRPMQNDPDRYVALLTLEKHDPASLA